jgi:UDP-GlcNAc:undecaprenyl-phosphate GlcNAc-1-phosphate transferase
LISLTITPLVAKFLYRKKLVEDPRKKTHPKVIHEYPVPRGGGIPVFLAILITSLIFLPLDKHLFFIMTAAAANLFVGLADDLWDISPYTRLATNIASATFIVIGGIGISYLTNPFGGILHLDKLQLTTSFLGSSLTIHPLSILLTIFWLVWCMNIIGWSGGVDGQLPGFVSISALVIGILSLQFSQDITQWPVIILAGAVAGAYLGFLPFNFYPQSIMPGYSGKSLAGFFLAILAILSGAKLATAILVLALPMVDGMLAIIRRVLRKKSPFWGDDEHLHHLLYKAGIPKPKIAILYWLFSAILGLMVLNLNSKQKVYLFAIVAVAIGIGTISIRIIINRKTKKLTP